MADPVEAARQHVQEKAADEFGGVERHGLEPVAAFDPVVLPTISSAASSGVAFISAFISMTSMEVDPKSGGFTRNADNPLDCDLLVVDEASMVG